VAFCERESKEDTKICYAVLNNFCGWALKSEYIYRVSHLRFSQRLWWTRTPPPPTYSNHKQFFPQCVFTQRRISFSLYLAVHSRQKRFDVIVRLLLRVCPSIRPRVATRPSLHGFSSNLVLGGGAFYSKHVRSFVFLLKIWWNLNVGRYIYRTAEMFRTDLCTRRWYAQKAFNFLFVETYWYRNN
jgi:hypothetical protein